MGLFSTVTHIYKKSQADIVIQLSGEFKYNQGFPNSLKIQIDNSNFEDVIQKEIYSSTGIFLLVTQQHGNWTTIIELNVNIQPPLYLTELTNSLSKRLNTFALSFHLHDDDVLFYNLEMQGNSLDGYNSNYQYFLTEPADKNEIESQRHAPEYFADILPAGKKPETLNLILNEGYWNAFDSGDLDDDGVPNDDKYFIDEEDRFVRIGKYLEIFSAEEYPFASWLENLKRLPLAKCYLLKTTR